MGYFFRVQNALGVQGVQEEPERLGRRCYFPLGDIGQLCRRYQIMIN